MQEASENARTNMQNVKFIDMLIGQWMKRTGNDIPHQTEEQAIENLSAQENAQHTLQKRERIIQDLKRRLKESQEAAAFLSTSLETETRNKEEIRMKLNATWESIETITEYFNYISESLTSFQQHRVNLSALFDNIILTQQESIQKLQLSNIKSKDMEDHVTQLKNTLLLREGRLQEAMMEQNKLCKQLESSEYELQLQKNELNTCAKEKLIFVKEQQRLILENENLKSRLQTIEKEKCDIAKSAAQLENKLLLQEEKMQDVLTEQKKLQKQVENTESEFHLQKSNLANAHAEEKKILVEEQQRLLSEFENLQSRMNTLEQDKNNIIEMVAQKNALLSKLQNEILTYKNEIEVMRTNNNEANTKYETLTEKQNMWDKESRAKTERIQNLEATVNAIKQRENKLINDVNRMEKRLTNEVNYSKDLENKLSKAQKNLQFEQEKNTEMQKTLEMTKSNSEHTNIELQQQLKVLQREKEDIIKRDNTKIKNTEVLYESTRAIHAEEMSALKNDYETQLLELRKTTDSLNDMINNVRRKENTAVNKSSIKISNLKYDYKLTTKHNEDFQEKLKEAKEALQMKSPDSIEDRKFNSEFSKSQPNIFTFADNSDDEKDEPPIHTYSMSSREKRKEIKEQEAKVMSAGRKFFKSRTGQPRTYTKRRY
ncbi:putative leucine-rich repeat-containing protein DDB_G0290503 [Polyergus mexicanus]|uniref:putative leucine-rich repeat-containing protein DDB_G0290503 n=1 Tax=Polyergus mexicanus TaxID=615972 RepID=UPI0038B56711